MNNMWSENKIVNNVINILLFLVAINFMHYGQLILPVICLIIFIDHKFKITVNNTKIFVVLCLFAITFCLFSYKLGFYCVMGFCIPMAYYIGCNINDKEENIKKVIYIITFGMVIHVLLNMVLDISIYGMNFLQHQSHYDIWLQDELTPTITSVYMDYALVLIYFVINYEKNIRNKIIILILLLLTLFYSFALGRRTQLLFCIIGIVFSIFVDMVLNKRNGIKNIFKKMVLCFIVFAISIVIAYVINPSLFKYLTIFNKFRDEGFSSGRLEILLSGIKYLPQYLFGGQKISEVNGLQFHSLLLDIYDYAGIIPFTMMLIYVVYQISVLFKVTKKESISKNIKLLILVIYMVIGLQCLLEPIMTGESLFLICSIIISSCVEKLVA